MTPEIEFWGQNASLIEYPTGQSVIPGFNSSDFSDLDRELQVALTTTLRGMRDKYPAHMHRYTRNGSLVVRGMLSGQEFSVQHTEDGLGMKYIQQPSSRIGEINISYTHIGLFQSATIDTVSGYKLEVELHEGTLIMKHEKQVAQSSEGDHSNGVVHLTLGNADALCTIAQGTFAFMLIENDTGGNGQIEYGIKAPSQFADSSVSALSAEGTGWVGVPEWRKIGLVITKQSDQSR